MSTRHRSVSSAIVAVALGVPGWTRPVQARTDRQTTHLTFGAAVALPQVTLPPGTYVFERMFAGAPSVVVVRSADGRTVYFMRPTLPSGRPSTLGANEVVAFGEARRGEPRPIAGWYPRGADLGFAFVY